MRGMLYGSNAIPPAFQLWDESFNQGGLSGI
jgi:hypothetical protein